MCDASASVFYGLFVQTAYLCGAAQVWEGVEPALRALDLIKLRRRKGTLDVDSTSRISIAGLPEEVLDLVAAWLGADALLDGENFLVDEVHGDTSAIDSDYDDEGMPVRRTFTHLHLCHWCLQGYFARGALYGILKVHKESIPPFLKFFGLELVNEGPLTDDQWIADIESLSALTLSRSGSAHTLAHTSSQGLNAAAPYSLVQARALPSSFTTLPLNVNARFRKLLRLFPLPTASGDVDDQAVEWRKRGRRTSDEEAAKPKRATPPKWHILLSSRDAQ